MRCTCSAPLARRPPNPPVAAPQGQWWTLVPTLLAHGRARQNPRGAPPTARASGLGRGWRHRRRSRSPPTAIVGCWRCPMRTRAPRVGLPPLTYDIRDEHLPAPSEKHKGVPARSGAVGVQGDGKGGGGDESGEAQEAVGPDGPGDGRLHQLLLLRHHRRRLQQPTSYHRRLPGCPQLHR